MPRLWPRVHLPSLALLPRLFCTGVPLCLPAGLPAPARPPRPASSPRRHLYRWCTSRLRLWSASGTARARRCWRVSCCAYLSACYFSPCSTCTHCHAAAPACCPLPTPPFRTSQLPADMLKTCEAFPDGCIIFLDELDALATSRSTGGCLTGRVCSFAAGLVAWSSASVSLALPLCLSCLPLAPSPSCLLSHCPHPLAPCCLPLALAEMHEATRRVLGVLLRHLDGFDSTNKRTVVIGATNRKQAGGCTPASGISALATTLPPSTVQAAAPMSLSVPSRTLRSHRHLIHACRTWTQPSSPASPPLSTLVFRTRRAGEAGVGAAAGKTDAGGRSGTRDCGWPLLWLPCYVSLHSFARVAHMPTLCACLTTQGRHPAAVCAAPGRCRAAGGGGSHARHGGPRPERHLRAGGAALGEQGASVRWWWCPRSGADWRLVGVAGAGCGAQRERGS